MWGTLLLDGSPANNVEVKVEDVTQVFDKTVYTTSDGQYVVTLTNEGTVHNGDTIRVTVVGWQSIYQEDTATEGEDGSHFDFNKYTKTNTDTVNLSESPQKKAAKQFQESVTNSDSLLRNTEILKTESVTFAESYFKKTTQTHSHTVQLQDSRILSISRSRSESLQLSDSFARTQTLYKVLQEAVNATDSFNRVWTLYRALSEILQLNDIFARDVTWFKAFQEALQLADSVSRHLVYFRTEQESLQLQDVKSHVWAAKKQSIETINIADGYSRVWTTFRILTSTVQLADSRRLAFYTAKQEQLDLVDTIKKLISRTRQETLQLTDSVVHGDWSAHKSLVDLLGLTQATRKAVLQYNLTSNLLVNDLAPSIVHTIGSVTFSRTFESNLNVSDGLNRSLGKVLSDSLEIADLVSHGNWTIYRTVQDIVQLDDSISRFAKHLKRTLAAETLTIYDNPPSGLPGRSIMVGVRRRVLTEILQLTHPQPVFSLGIVRSDTLQLSDTWSRVWMLYRALTENISLTDLMSSDLYGPFQGSMELARLGTALELKQLVSALDLKRLQSALELRQGEQ